MEDDKLKQRYGEAGCSVPLVVAITMLFIRGFSLLGLWEWWIFLIIGGFLFALLMIIPYLLVEKLYYKLQTYMILLSMLIYLFYFWLAYYLFKLFIS